MSIKKLNLKTYARKSSLLTYAWLGWLFLLALIGTITTFVVGKGLALPVSIVIMVALLGVLLFFEGNSAQFKAKKALDKGLLQEALGYYDQAGLFDKQVACLINVLPKSKLSNTIIEAADELGQLKHSLLGAGIRNSNNSTVNNLKDDAFRASELVWQLADRVSRLQSSDVEIKQPRLAARLAIKIPFIWDNTADLALSPLNQIINEQINKVEALTEATRQSREALTIVLLSNLSGSGDMLAVETRLKCLNQAVVELYNTEKSFSN